MNSEHLKKFEKLYADEIKKAIDEHINNNGFFKKIFNKEDKFNTSYFIRKIVNIFDFDFTYEKAISIKDINAFGLYTNCVTDEIKSAIKGTYNGFEINAGQINLYDENESALSYANGIFIKIKTNKSYPRTVGVEHEYNNEEYDEIDLRSAHLPSKKLYSECKWDIYTEDYKKSAEIINQNFIEKLETIYEALNVGVIEFFMKDNCFYFLLDNQMTIFDKFTKAEFLEIQEKGKKKLAFDSYNCVFNEMGGLIEVLDIFLELI